MRLKIFLIISLLLFPLFLNSSVFAQAPIPFYDWSTTLETRQIRAKPVLGTTTIRYPQQFQRYKNYFIAGNLTPDSPFYFIKSVQETITINLTFDQKKKQELKMQLAGERLNEIQELTKKGKYGSLTKASQNYRNLIKDLNKDLKKLEEKGVDVSSLLQSVNVEVTKHTIILEEISVKVPSQSKTAISQAVEASYEGVDTVADLTKKPAVPKEVVDRIQALKAQGILTQEEAAKIISLKSRVEAREELKKFVNEGIFPEADLMKLNDSAKELYSQDFYKIHEIKRFYEIKRLEQEKPDSETLAKIQAFAKEYKPGDTVPADIRKEWIIIIRKDELDNTFRPDLVDQEVFRGNNEDAKKFTEIVERYKPRPEDVAFINDYLKKNPGAGLPPEYERAKALSEKLGTASATEEASLSKTLSCPSNTHFVTYAGVPEGGYCIPNFTIREEKVESGIKKEFPCPSGYFRPDPNSFCMPVYNSGEPPLKPATSTPGEYPNPIYPPTTLSNPPVGGGPSPTSQPTPTPTVTNLIYPPAPQTTPSPPPAGGPTPTINPPSGYGNCPSGQIWNGYICMVYPPPAPTQAPQPPPSPSPIPTSVPSPTVQVQIPEDSPMDTWVTYTNPEGLYTLRHPREWNAGSPPPSGFINYAPLGGFTASMISHCPINEDATRSTGSDQCVYITQRVGSNFTTKDQIYDPGSRFWPPANSDSEVTIPEKINLGGVDFMKRTEKSKMMPETPYFTSSRKIIRTYYYTYLKPDPTDQNRVYVLGFTALYYDSTPGATKRLETFEKILSTIKLNISEPSNFWKTVVINHMKDDKASIRVPFDWESRPNKFTNIMQAWNSLPASGSYYPLPPPFYDIRTDKILIEFATQRFPTKHLAFVPEPEINESIFFNPESQIWPRSDTKFTYSKPQEIQIGGRRGMMQTIRATQGGNATSFVTSISRPPYPGNDPNLVLKNYYFYNGKGSQVLTFVRLLYYETVRNKDTFLSTFEKIVSTLKLY